MRLTLCLFFLHIQVGYFAQTEPDSVKNKKGIEKFDSKKYKVFKIKNKAEDTLADGSIIRYFENREFFQEETRNINSPYKTQKKYFKDNLLLNSEAHYFYDMPIGVRKEFNHSGKLIKALDYESVFKFSLKSISIMMFKNYGIDINRDKNFGISRHLEDVNNAYYEIHIFSGGNVRVLLINGLTGDVFSNNRTTIKK